MTVINLTGGNEKLAKLKNLRRDDWLSLKLNQLPKSIKEDVVTFIKALTGEELGDEETVTRVRYEEGFYVRSYAPAIYASEEGELLLVLGDKRYVLVKEVLEEFSAEIIQYKFENYDEVSLQLMYAVDDDNVLLWPFQLKLNTENYQTETTKLKLLLKKPKTKDLAKCLFVKSENSGSYSDDKPGVITDLPQNVPMPILGVKDLLVNARGGGKRPTNIVTVSVDGEEKRIWANSDMNNVFFCGGKVTPNSCLVYFTRKKGDKERVFVDITEVEYEVENLEESLKV